MHAGGQGVMSTCTDNEIDRLFRGNNRSLAASVIGIIADLEDYWPLTVRQVYYQCVAKLLIPNDHKRYKAISVMVATLRRNDLVTWDAIEDRTRRTTDKRGVSDLQTFVKEQAEYFLDWRYYHRCRVQEQEFYIEVATEKDALASIIEEVAWPYCVRLNVCKGQVSATMVKQMADRFKKAPLLGQVPLLLYFGDLDPSGVAIPKAIESKLKEFHNTFVLLRRVALNPDQLSRYGLPVSPDAAKKKDPNYDKWIAEYGDTPPTELDALHPKDLRELVKTAIEDKLDMGSFRDQMDIEDQERITLKKMRRKIMRYAHDNYPGYFHD